eukprot:6823757-Prymnesium_polylepis.1
MHIVDQVDRVLPIFRSQRFGLLQHPQRDEARRGPGMALPVVPARQRDEQLSKHLVRQTKLDDAERRVHSACRQMEIEDLMENCQRLQRVLVRLPLQPRSSR